MAILGHKSHAVAERLQAHLGDVPTIDLDRSSGEVHDPEQRLEERTLSCSGPAHNTDLTGRTQRSHYSGSNRGKAYLLAGVDLEANAFEH